MPLLYHVSRIFLEIVYGGTHDIAFERTAFQETAEREHFPVGAPYDAVVVFYIEERVVFRLGFASRLTGREPGH